VTIKKRTFPHGEVLVRIPSLDRVGFIAPFHSPYGAVVANLVTSPTRLSSLMSPVRPIRTRLIRTTSRGRRREHKHKRSTTINKETDVCTPVSRMIMLAVAADMPIHVDAGIEKGIRRDGLVAAY
jgi:hypothetical protein